MIGVLTSTRHDLGHLLFPILVKHLIRFVDDGATATGQVQQLNQGSGRRTEHETRTEPRDEP